MFRLRDKNVGNILDKIIEDKRIEVEAGKALTEVEAFQEKIASMGKCRNFHKAVTKNNARGVNVIAEIKKASPSAGLIRPDFDAVEIACTYEKCGADAISVLTDEKYFQGKLEYLAAVKQAVSIPVLRKDFIVDPWQIYQARAAGADAVLLIAEALNGAELMDMMILASQLTLTVLLEVHDVESLIDIRSMAGFPLEGYSVIGINNRNLTTMKVDLGHCCRVSGFLADGQGFVAESGIKTKADVDRVTRAGACGVLIGETLCRQGSIEDKFKELFG